MWEDDEKEAVRTRIVQALGVVAVIALVVGGWFWYTSRQKAPPPEPTPPPAVRAPEAAEAPPAHPLPAAGAGTAALPALNDSDALAHDSLVNVLGRAPVEEFLVPKNIIRHIVVTTDNLPRRKVAVELRPVKPTPGQLVITTQGDLTLLSDANFGRYAPLVRVVQAADVKTLAALYQKLYPLFQQAYEDLGYPGKYFNDRLTETIDNLLETPEVAAPIPLVQPRVMYEYSDASLERRSAGQKLLIRMGPANARVIKEKLREFRAEIVNKK